MEIKTFLNELHIHQIENAKQLMVSASSFTLSSGCFKTFLRYLISSYGHLSLFVDLLYINKSICAFRLIALPCREALNLPEHYTYSY